MRYLSFILVLMVGMSSCDTRDDYFLEHGDAPIIEMKTANDTLGVEYWEGKRYRVIEVGFGKPDTLSFSINDPYGKECTYELKFESLPAENEANGVFAEEFMMFFGDDVCYTDAKMPSYPTPDLMNMDTYKRVFPDGEIKKTFLKITETKGKIIYNLDLNSNSAEMAHDYWINMILAKNAKMDLEAEYNNLSKTNMMHDIPFSKEISARYALTAKNKIGTETTEFILVKIKPNKQPIPNITVTCVNKETNEYKIVAGGTDPDGHKIKKWSYVFDYEPFKIGSETLSIEYWLDNNHSRLYSIFDGCLYYDMLECYIQYANLKADDIFYYATFGMPKNKVIAKNIEADFITPTTRNEVSHVFQSKGEHTISVRCQDEYGLWSDYITEKIYIE